MLQSLFSLQLPITRKRYNKVRGTYFSKEVFARLIHCASMYSAYIYVLCVCIVNHGHGYTTLSRRSTRRKRPPPECFMCDHRIRGSVVVMPRTILPRRNRRCALFATGTWKTEEEKGRKRCDLFYGGECDKPM